MSANGCYTGLLSEDVLQRIQNGQFYEIVAIGRDFGLTDHLKGLAKAIESETCFLRKLVIRMGDWPKGQTVNLLFEALASTQSC